ncbi:hypothetical protein FVP74_03830 [Microbacterium saccharophilum]|uniref:Uncharacterized protein n=1 Tax=Microbacterium saccharophilum TaxID=1213358 RepID=A0A5C8I8Q1_9MICO|nr:MULTISPECIES: hypothetical protein [Microbacterium]TXK15525.1 hypothetical protein FVP74_03830 [Microbacterium saccharophilum]GEP49321.1 hypothetical protein MSA03_28290 [Microbacterium saccharophilum]SFI79502.1 hypothetical protein SAMN04487751_3006 [Microbacterium saccharophilum]
MTDSPARARSVHSVLSTILAVVAILPPAALVVFLVGSLLLSGGQVSASMDTKWDAVRPYPLFAVPTVVLVVLAVVSVVLALLVAVTARAGDETGLRGLVGPLVGAIIAAILFAVLIPDGGTREGDITVGGQWIAAIVSAAALGAVLLGAAGAAAKSRAQGQAA